MKLIYAPIGIVSGLIAGLLARRGFDRLWSVFDEEEPPEPDQRDISYPKLIMALLIEGAIFRVVKGIVEHGTRGAFARMTGSWPGEEKADPSE